METFNEDTIKVIKAKSKTLHESVSPQIEMIAMCWLRNEFILGKNNSENADKLSNSEVVIRQDELQKTINFCLVQIQNMLQIE